MTRGVTHQPIADTPVAVIDFETTGLSPGADRVVEVSVARIDPGEAPRLVFDSLVNPDRPLAATHIHRITDADVAQAPRFQDIAGELVAAVQGCVIAAYNVYFDIKFLDFELSSVGVDHAPPHFCLMYLRPMLGLGARCNLAFACLKQRVVYTASHVAAHDALAAGQLFRRYLVEMRRQGVNTFADLATRGNYKFNASFSRDPFPAPTAFGLQRCLNVVSRSGLSTKNDSDERAQAGSSRR